MERKHSNMTSDLYLLTFPTPTHTKSWLDRGDRSLISSWAPLDRGAQENSSCGVPWVLPLVLGVSPGHSILKQ